MEKKWKKSKNLKIEKYITKVRAAINYKMKKNGTSRVSKKAIHQFIETTYNEKNKEEMKCNIERAVKKMIKSKECTKSNRSIVSNISKNEIIEKKMNNDAKIESKIRRLWRAEKKKMLQEQTLLNTRNIQHFLINKSQVYEEKETKKITWTLPEDLRVMGINDVVAKDTIKKFEIPKEQVIDNEETFEFEWKIPHGIKISESIEDSTIVNELKELSKLVGEIKEKKQQLEMIYSEITFKLEKVEQLKKNNK